VKKLKKVFL